MALANFTHFCCRSGGSNLNAGTRTGDTTVPGTTAFKTYTGGTWVQATRVFTPAGGADPSADGLVVGDFVSVYPDATTSAVFIGRISAVDSTTFTVDATAKSGTAPVDGTSNTSAKIGGAWLGPTGATPFFPTFPAAVMTNAAGHIVRVNIMNDANIAITAVITLGAGNCTVFAGFNAAYGDGGLATIDGTLVGASYNLISVGAGASPTRFEYLKFNENGTTGAAAGFLNAAGGCQVFHCVFSNMRGHGFSNTLRATVIECEAFGNNESNTATTGGFHSSTDHVCFLRCISHDNTGTNTSGFVLAAGGFLINCIADTNGANGALLSATTNPHIVTGCDFYNNGLHGLNFGISPLQYVENSNFFKNGTTTVGWGIFFGTTIATGQIRNCSFGAGTMANDDGAIQSGDSYNSTTYTDDLHPWVDPDDGDFSLDGDANSRSTGRGTFTETAASYAGTVGYPDRGAAPPDAAGAVAAGPVGRQVIVQGIGTY